MEASPFFAKESWNSVARRIGRFLSFSANAETMRGLNAQYRNIDAPTDVLSFSLGEKEGDMWAAGDIVIALPVVSENAKYFGVSEEEELKRLVIHGILHLEGFDHATNDVNEPMLVLQENILRQVKGECLF
jgi:probable rRNA maturation factor